MCVDALHPSVVVETNFLNWCRLLLLVTVVVHFFPSHHCVQEMFNTTTPKTSYQWSGSNRASSVAHHLHLTSYSLSVPVFTTATTCPYPEPHQSRSCFPLPPFLFLRVHFNINLPYMPRFSKRYLSIRFWHKKYLCTFPLLCMCHMSHPSHSSWLITQVTSGEEYRLWSSSLCSFL